MRSVQQRDEEQLGGHGVLALPEWNMEWAGGFIMHQLHGWIVQ